MEFILFDENTSQGSPLIRLPGASGTMAFPIRDGKNMANHKYLVT